MKAKQFIFEKVDPTQGVPTGTDLPNWNLPDLETSDPSDISPVFDLELDQNETEDQPITEMEDRQEKQQLIEIIMTILPDLERNYLEFATIDELKEMINLVRNEPRLDENLKKWFKEKWVRFGPDGKIRGSCARGSESEGKPKCLPQSKAHSLGKKGRASAAARKRRKDPDPERQGSAINVATKEAKLTGPYRPQRTPRQKFNDSLRARGFDPDQAAKRLQQLLARQAEERAELDRRYAELDNNETKQGVDEGGPFSYGAKKPRKDSVADLADQRRRKQERGKSPIEPQDQMVGTAKVTKGVAEAKSPEEFVRGLLNPQTPVGPDPVKVLTSILNRPSIKKYFSVEVDPVNSHVQIDRPSIGMFLSVTVSEQDGKILVSYVDEGHTHRRAENISLSKFIRDFGEIVSDNKMTHGFDKKFLAPGGLADKYNWRPKNKGVTEGSGLDQQALAVADKLTSQKNLQKLQAMAHDSTVYRALDRYFAKNNIPENIYNRVANIVFQKINQQGVAEGIFDKLKQKFLPKPTPMPRDRDIIRVIGREVKINYVPGGYIGFTWRDKNGEEHTEEVYRGDYRGSQAGAELTKDIAAEIKHADNPGPMDPGVKAIIDRKRAEDPQLDDIMRRREEDEEEKPNLATMRTSSTIHEQDVAEGSNEIDQQAHAIADKLTTGKNLQKLRGMAYDSTVYRALDRYFEKHNIPETIYNRVAAIVFQRINQQGVAEGKQSCPECGGALVEFSQLNEKKDACYYKVKSRYKVWPSAYASGALVQCRKKGSKNWGKKS